MTRCPQLLAMVLLLASASVPAQTAPAPPQTAPATRPAAQLSLQMTREENRDEIQALLMSEGKPVADATVAFSVRRTFGTLTIGQDQTLDDGTADVPFPNDLPGGPRGELTVVATVLKPPAYAGVQGSNTFAGARIVLLDNPVPPRALWAPRAPWTLILAIFGLLAVVWCTYAFVVVQLFRISRGR